MVDFHFEQSENYKVEVYDSDDDRSKDLSKHDFIGALEFQLHEVNTARDQTMTKPLVNQQRGVNRNGNITLSATELPATANSEVVIFNPVATLPESSLCFFLVYREAGPGKWTPVYKSEIKRPEGGAFKWNQV